MVSMIFLIFVTSSYFLMQLMNSVALSFHVNDGNNAD